MWGQLATRPDLCYPKALLHVLGYIKGTTDYGVVYSRDEPLVPVGFIDADYGGCWDTMRSTSGYVFAMAGGPVCWSSKRQATVALSTVEAEYILLTRAAQQMMWMMSWMEKVRLPQPRPALLYGDNQGAVALTSNTRSHHKVKHINIREHFIRELVQAGDLKVEFIRGDLNPADMFTKLLAQDAHHRYLEALSIMAMD
ncbi:uncharacterized protein ARMOST_01565 [Armillaria ostoyae]|uniref:Reverse transcriptase Ty1/copia-type domain-containing protein n=1 Tax=Armillaria ostoyae TaxID=47428 RepID=A0A284QPG4_ARMOS|nr:uncharacterized protein ARMOST_01565 [Armillaria ostoyae]